jgi:hypothetical protein
MRCFAVPLLVLLLAAPAAAQSCPGDCNGDGIVRVEEMVVGVRLALGNGSTDECPAFDGDGDGEVSIDELVRAVASVLGGCPATPTPPATPTATPTGADTPTATPTIPPVGGNWLEEALTVDDSSCPAPLTTAFGEELAARGPCAQVVEMTGEDTVRVTDCSQQVVDGTLERDGTMRLAFAPSVGMVEGCTLTLSTSSVVSAGGAPARARYTFAIAFDEACGLVDCAIEASGGWARTE